MKFYCEFTIQKEVELTGSDAKLVDDYAKEHNMTIEDALWELRQDLLWVIEEGILLKWQ